MKTFGYGKTKELAKENLIKNIGELERLMWEY
jgi:hypothetical protein